MNLRDLHYVCSVAELGHFGRAAEANHVSQPTLSGQIAKLEDTLGITLFERTKRSVRLTPAGADIVAVAREVLLREGEIERIAQAHKDPLAEPLRIGLIPTIAPYLIPLLAGPLQERFPKLKTIFVEAITDQLVKQLTDGVIDGAILATVVGDPKLGSLPLYEEPFMLAVPRGHELEHAETVELGRIDPDAFLLLTEGHCFRDQALALCKTGAAAGPADTTATSLETIINLVGAGQGITLVPALAARGAWTTDLGVIVRPLDDSGASRNVHLVYRNAFPRQNFLQDVAQLVRDIAPNTVTVSDGRETVS